MNDRPRMQLLGRHHWKTMRQIEAHLITKDTQRAGAGAIILARAGIAHMAHQIQILLQFTTLVVRLRQPQVYGRPELLMLCPKGSLGQSKADLASTSPMPYSLYGHRATAQTLRRNGISHKRSGTSRRLPSVVVLSD